MAAKNPNTEYYGESTTQRIKDLLFQNNFDVVSTFKKKSGCYLFYTVSIHNKAFDKVTTQTLNVRYNTYTLELKIDIFDDGMTWVNLNTPIELYTYLWFDQTINLEILCS